MKAIKFEVGKAYVCRERGNGVMVVLGKTAKALKVDTHLANSAQKAKYSEGANGEESVVVRGSEYRASDVLENYFVYTWENKGKMRGSAKKVAGIYANYEVGKMYTSEEVENTAGNPEGELEKIKNNGNLSAGEKAAKMEEVKAAIIEGLQEKIGAMKYRIENSWRMILIDTKLAEHWGAVTWGLVYSEGRSKEVVESCQNAVTDSLDEIVYYEDVAWRNWAKVEELKAKIEELEEGTQNAVKAEEKLLKEKEEELSTKEAVLRNYDGQIKQRVEWIIDYYRRIAECEDEIAEYGLYAEGVKAGIEKLRVEMKKLRDEVATRKAWAKINEIAAEIVDDGSNDDPEEEMLINFNFDEAEEEEDELIDEAETEEVTFNLQVFSEKASREETANIDTGVTAATPMTKDGEIDNKVKGMVAEYEGSIKRESELYSEVVKMEERIRALKEEIKKEQEKRARLQGRIEHECRELKKWLVVEYESAVWSMGEEVALKPMVIKVGSEEERVTAQMLRDYLKVEYYEGYNVKYLRTEIGKYGSVGEYKEVMSGLVEAASRGEEEYRFR